MIAALRRLLDSFRTLPDRAGWAFTTLVGLPTLLAMAAIGLTTGL